MSKSKKIRKTLQRSFSILILVTLFLYSEALACPVCYGDKESAEVEGTRWAIMFLLGVTGTVLSGVIAFVLHLRRRARFLQDGSADLTSST